MSASPLPPLLALLLLGACSGDRKAGRVEGENVWRIRDDSVRVICWIYARPYRGGLSCLPESSVEQRGAERP